MKKMKKLASILLAAIMVLAMAVPAMATAGSETKGTIVVEDMNGKVLQAYQIFSGTQGGVDKTKLADIEWGSGIDKSTFPEELAKSGILSGITEAPTAEKLAEELAKLAGDEPTLQKFAEFVAEHVTGTYTTLHENENLVDSGYYLILDKSAGTGVGSIVNVALLQVTNDGTTNVKMKTSIPSVDKDVSDDDDQDASSEDPDLAPNDDTWGETADHDIDETFQYKLTAKIPKDVRVSTYEHYVLTFVDNISKGITYKGNLKVYISNTAPSTADENLMDGDDYTTDEWFSGSEQGPKEGKLTINDVKTISSPTINPSGDIFITVVYDAALNGEAVVTTPDNGDLSNTENNNNVKLEYSNNPSADTKGETTTDNVYVFTYDIPGLKVDGSNDKAPLAGAEFALYKESGEGVVFAKIDTVNDNKLIGWTDVTTEKTSDGKWVVPEGATSIASDLMGKFNFAGLDVGQYYLKETKTPEGYNTVSDIFVEITVDSHKEVASGAEATELVNKSAQIEVENNQGATLPETGGIGTTIFYVLGSILVLGAVILLVTKKRMSVEK